MTPRHTHLLLAALTLASLAGGIAALRFLPGARSVEQTAAPAIGFERRAGGTLLPGLRGHAAPEPRATPEPEPPAPIAEAPQPPPAPLPAMIGAPTPEIDAAVSFPPDFPATTPEAQPDAASQPAPLPPARPADLAALVPGETPLPPARPDDLTALAAASPDSAPQPTPQTAPEPPAAPEPQQVAHAPEPTLRPAPDDAFQQQAPVRFGMGDPVFVRIFKQEGQLELWLKRNGRFSLYKTYPICKWSGRLGPKVKEADYQSPEGFYSVSTRQLNPNSNYYRAFNVGYPNAFDRQNGRTGGLVMVHGACKSVGCFAMTDPGIEEIYGFVAAALAAGQQEVPVHIFPFRMTESTIARETGGGWMAFVGGGNYSQWSQFWRNLKEGYDLFEQTGEPPVAFACGDHYAFGAGSASCRRIAGW